MAKTLENAIRQYKNKRYKQALDTLLGLNTNPEESPEVAYYLGLCYAKLENFEEALMYLEQVVTSKLNFLQVYQSRMLLGYIYAVTGRYKLAEFEMNKILKEGYESAQAYSLLAYTEYEQKKYDDSISHLEKAVEVENGNANALNSLGYILADTGKDVKKGLDLCKQAVTEDPENPAYLDSLGWAYFKSNNIQEARKFIRKAMDKAENNKTISAHMKKVREYL